MGFRPNGQLTDNRWSWTDVEMERDKQTATQRRTRSRVSACDLMGNGTSYGVREEAEVPNPKCC